MSSNPDVASIDFWWQVTNVKDENSNGQSNKELKGRADNEPDSQQQQQPERRPKDYRAENIYSGRYVSAIKGLTCLAAGFPWSIDGHFDGFRVGSHLRGSRIDGDGQREALAWFGPTERPPRKEQKREMSRSLAYFCHQICIAVGYKEADKGRTSSGTADEPEIVELGHVVLHDGRGVAEFGAPVLVVAGADGDQSAVVDSAEANDAKSRRQRLVGAPVGGQR